MSLLTQLAAIPGLSLPLVELLRDLILKQCQCCPDNAPDVAIWDDAEARALVKPAMAGAIGVQLDDQSIWIAGSDTVGDWDLYQPADENGEESIVDILDVSFASGLSDQFTGAAWTPVTGGIQNNSSDPANKYRTVGQFGFDRRIIKWNFVIGTVGGIAYFGTDPRFAQTPTAGMLIRANATTNRLELMAGWDGVNIGAALQSVTPDGFVLTNGVEYELSMECNNRQFVFDLKPVKGAGLASISHLSGPWTYTVFPGTVGYDAGTFQGCPCAHGGAPGSLILRRFRHYLRSKNAPLLAIFGDSRVEGLNCPEGQRTVDYLRASLGDDEVASSAIGGSNSTDIIARFNTEFPLIKPRFTLIWVGANADAAFNANLTTLASLILAGGSIPLIATEPTSSAKTAFVKTLTGVRIVNFDTAVTTSGAQSGYPVEFYIDNSIAGGTVNDSVHENHFGHKVLFDQISQDVPELRLPPHRKFLQKDFQPFNPIAFRAHSNQRNVFPVSVENSFQAGFASLAFLVNQILVGYLRGDFGGNMALVLPGTGKLFSIRMNGDVGDSGSDDAMVVAMNGTTIQSGLKITRPANAADLRSMDIFVSSPAGDIILGPTLDNGTILQAFGIRRNGNLSFGPVEYQVTGAPTVTDVPAGTWRVINVSGTVRLYANVGGVLKSVSLA